MTTNAQGLVERRERRLALLLAATDVPAPRLAFPAVRIMEVRRARRLARWRVAAVLVLLAGAMSAEPVRAWVAARARAVWSVLHVAPERSPALTTAPPPAHASVAFVPAPGRFQIHIGTRQAAGRLTVEFVADTAVTATASSGAGEWLVSESGIALKNDAAGVASVLIQVPAATSGVVVRIGDEPPVVRTGNFTIPLGRTRPM